MLSVCRSISAASFLKSTAGSLRNFMVLDPLQSLEHRENRAHAVHVAVGLGLAHALALHLRWIDPRPHGEFVMHLVDQLRQREPVVRDHRAGTSLMSASFIRPRSSSPILLTAACSAPEQLR